MEQYNLLIVDDEEIEREGLRMLIERGPFPFCVRLADSGEEALALLEGFDCDLLITDIKMAETDGLALCEKAKEKNPDLKTIVISAYGEFAYTKEAIRLKVDDYLLKPVVPEQFHEVIRGMCVQLEHLKQREQLLAAYMGANIFQKEIILEKLKKLDQKVEPGEALPPDGIMPGKVVQQVIALIEQNYGRDIGLQWLAEQVYLSPGYLSSLFKQEVGKSVTQYLTIFRLETAKRLLENTNLKISYIGEQVGYSNSSYFGVIFKNYFGATAAQVRRDSGHSS